MHSFLWLFLRTIKQPSPCPRIQSTTKRPSTYLSNNISLENVLTRWEWLTWDQSIFYLLSLFLPWNLFEIYLFESLWNLFGAGPLPAPPGGPCQCGAHPTLGAFGAPTPQIFEIFHAVGGCFFKPESGRQRAPGSRISNSKYSYLLIEGSENF